MADEIPKIPIDFDRCEGYRTEINKYMKDKVSKSSAIAIATVSVVIILAFLGWLERSQSPQAELNRQAIEVQQAAINALVSGQNQLIAAEQRRLKLDEHIAESIDKMNAIATALDKRLDRLEQHGGS